VLTRAARSAKLATAIVIVFQKGFKMSIYDRSRRLGGAVVSSSVVRRAYAPKSRSLIDQVIATVDGSITRRDHITATFLQTK
jgi:hypothetical protein